MFVVIMLLGFIYNCGLVNGLIGFTLWIGLMIVLTDLKQ